MPKIVKNVPAQRKTTANPAAPKAKPNPATPPKESKVKAEPSAPCCPNPKWMDIAKKEAEKNIVERGGLTKNHPDILKYAALNANKTTDDETAWCGAFVNWCLSQAGYQQRSTVPERALTWGRTSKHEKGWWPGGLNIGAKPIYGAIAVKGRTGGGHVTFVAGKHPTNPKKIICLGGNQGDALQAVPYDITDFHAFMVPKDYPYQCCGLDIYKGKFKEGGEIKES